jgi:hypothetical protein
MKYTKPQLLNVKKASLVIMGPDKEHSTRDNDTPDSTVIAYRSDE